MPALRWISINISIHALRVEGDFAPQVVTLCGKKFLSTPSVWRATSETVITIR